MIYPLVKKGTCLLCKNKVWLDPGTFLPQKQKDPDAQYV